MSNRKRGSRKGVGALSTKKLKKRLQGLGKSSDGKGNDLVKRHKACQLDAGEEEDGDETPVMGRSPPPMHPITR